MDPWSARRHRRDEVYGRLAPAERGAESSQGAFVAPRVFYGDEATTMRDRLGPYANFLQQRYREIEGPDPEGFAARHRSKPPKPVPRRARHARPRQSPGHRQRAQTGVRRRWSKVQFEAIRSPAGAKKASLITTWPAAGPSERRPQCPPDLPDAAQPRAEVHVLFLPGPGDRASAETLRRVDAGVDQGRLPSTSPRAMRHRPRAGLRHGPRRGSSGRRRPQSPGRRASRRPARSRRSRSRRRRRRRAPASGMSRLTRSAISPRHDARTWSAPIIASSTRSDPPAARRDVLRVAGSGPSPLRSLSIEALLSGLQKAQRPQPR